jgi:hypothetical protein
MDVEGDLDRLGAGGLEVDAAHLARAVRRERAQRPGLAGHAAAVRAHHVPRQLEETGARRVQADPQERVLVEAPGASALSDLDAIEVLLVAGLDPVDQAPHGLAVEAALDQRPRDGVEPGLGAGGQDRRRRDQQRRAGAIDLGGDAR